MHVGLIFLWSADAKQLLSSQIIVYNFVLYYKIICIEDYQDNCHERFCLFMDKTVPLQVEQQQQQ